MSLVQRPLFSFLFSSYSFSKSFPTRLINDKQKKERGKFEVVFSLFLSVLRLIPSSCKLAVVQRGKYLTLIITSLFIVSLSSAMTLEKFHGWNIQLLEEEMIGIERSGDVEGVAPRIDADLLRICCRSRPVRTACGHLFTGG